MKPESMLSLGGQSHKFYCLLSLSIQITDLFPHCLLSHRPHCFSNLSHSAFTNFYKLGLTDYFTGCLIFLQPRELWKVWCLLLSAGFLFTPLCPDSLQTLQFTLCGKQDRTLCVGFPSSWHGYRPLTKPGDNAQQPQQTRSAKLCI